MNLADALQSRRYKDGECVIQQVPTLITSYQCLAFCARLQFIPQTILYCALVGSDTSNMAKPVIFCPS